jgi:hypothetical protein
MRMRVVKGREALKERAFNKHILGIGEKKTREQNKGKQKKFKKKTRKHMALKVQIVQLYKENERRML